MTYPQQPYDPYRQPQRPPDEDQPVYLPGNPQVHGQQQYQQPPGGYESGQPPQPYPAYPPPRRSRKWVWLTIGVAVFLVLAGVGITAAALARGDNPVTALVGGEDPGVEACEAIRDAEQDPTAGDDEPLTFEEYQQLRGQFADSKHEAIRTNGIKLIDIAWQIEQLGEDAGLEALPLIGSFTEAYAGLSGGCAEQGVQIPPLEFETP